MQHRFLSAPGTFSKDPAFWGAETVFPVRCLARGRRANVLAQDGRWYLDWVSGLGAIILGYGGHFGRKVAAGWSKMGGAGWSLPHSLEYEVAEMLATRLADVPGWQSTPLSVRFCKTGSDALTMAVRLARAVTGRTKVVKITGGYHGWHDWTIETTKPAWGVAPSGTVEVEAQDLAAAVDHHTACVVIEPALESIHDPFWSAVRKETRDAGALLILDETVTFLRYHPVSFSTLVGLQPDLVCGGKALGNGLPINALCGPWDYLSWFARSDPVFCSSTHWGESLSLLAARIVLEEINDQAVGRIWQTGAKLMAGLRRAGYQVRGDPPRFLLVFSEPVERAFFIASMAQRGILINRPVFPNLAHSPNDIDLTVTTADEVRVEFEKSRQEIMQTWQDKLPLVLFQNR